MLETLNTVEGDLVKGSAGVIITETCSGFVYVDYYETRAQLDAAWSIIERAYGPDDDDLGADEDSDYTLGDDPNA
jgi:hypothetical protein